MTTYRFEEVRIKGIRRWTENGRKHQETRTFIQTINPFNKNAAGKVKTHSEIMAELIEERRQWLKEDDCQGECGMDHP